MREITGLRDILRRNLGYKVVSIVLAIIVWASIVTTTNPNLLGQNSLPVQLSTKNQASNIAVTSTIPYITVQLEDASQVKNMSNIVAYVDLKGAIAGEHTYQVDISNPDNIQIKDHSPKTVTLKLESVKDKIVQITPTITGEPASGYEAGELILTPSMVAVHGPESVLAKLNSVTVEVVITGLTESKSIPLPIKFADSLEGLDISDPTMQAVKFYPDKVDVIVPIYEKGSASKMVPLSVTTKGNLVDGFELRQVAPLPSQVKLIGPEAALKTISSIDLGTLNIEGIRSNKEFDIALSSVSLPDGVTFSAGTKISVLVSVAPKVVTQTMQVAVQVKNIADGLKAETIAPITVTVSGYPDTLKSLKAADINAWVDTKGLKEGNYKDTTVLWELPSGVTMVNIPRVELVLKAAQ